jgi:hypothetical protein
MSTGMIRPLIVAVMVSQFLWFVIMPARNRLAPRSPEMAQAVRTFETNRSAATKAAMWEQVRRDELRDSRRKEVLFGLVLVVDVVVIYFFWNYEVKIATA